jgi:hypothetical protein
VKRILPFIPILVILVILAPGGLFADYAQPAAVDDVAVDGFSLGRGGSGV